MRQRARSGNSSGVRFRATPELRTAIERQGRRFDWLADKLGVSSAFVSRIVSGKRTISEADARVITALIDGDFGMLFELPDDTENESMRHSLIRATP